MVTHSQHWLPCLTSGIEISADELGPYRNYSLWILWSQQQQAGFGVQLNDPHVHVHQCEYVLTIEGFDMPAWV